VEIQLTAINQLKMPCYPVTVGKVFFKHGKSWLGLGQDMISSGRQVSIASLELGIRTGSCYLSH
jgi:hypothetical protein